MRRVVAVGEGFHGTAEGLSFRNRLFRYLVENLGFRVIAIESGITEGRVVHDYVTGTSGDIGTVMQQGISMGFDRFPQNEELVTWMREWNADPRHQQKLEFFGFDVPGSSGNPLGRRDVRTALEETLNYLARVDATNELEFPGFSGDASGEVCERLRTALDSDLRDGCDVWSDCRTRRCSPRPPRSPAPGSYRSAS